jgi:hypothetical protein
MAGTREYSRSFAGGEISPEMYGRIDDAKYLSGAATLRNFLALPTGPAQNRAGFAFVKGTKNNGKARLIPFTFSLNQTMVVELGDKYARFHTNGATLVYNPASLAPWRPPSPDLGYTYTAPAVITWNAHGLATGDPIRFYQSGTSGTVPTGLKFSYTYTVQRIDANSFNILDQSGNPVAFTGGSGAGSVTNYPGTGTPSASINLSPNQIGNVTSLAVGGLANVPTGVGGVVTLNVTLTASVYRYQSSGLGIVQYSNDGGATWNTFTGAGSSISTTISQQIALSNLNLLKLRVNVSGQAGPSGSIAIDLTVNSWSVDVPTSGGGGGGATLRAYRYYTASDAVTYGGSSWVSVMADSGGVTVPGTNAAIWYQLPADGTYEIPTPYAAGDLFSIRYAQSADVLTLVHTSYPPAELRRLSATAWSLTNIVFGPPLATPASVAAKASPGYLAKISIISTANPALITTVASHTLALGSGVYVANLTAVIAGANVPLDGFYMVSKVPVDGTGALIPNELYLMDYSGNNLDSTGWTSWHATDGVNPATIQLGSKIFNITNEYAVQAIASDGVSSSDLSASASILNNLNVPGSYNTISWAAASSAASYNVFKKYNGLWGFIGNTKDLLFNDQNIAPDFSIVPGIPDLVFASAGNYPGSVCYFQQRRCFAGTTNGPDNCWMSNSGTESMFSYSLPSLATDRIAFRVAALKADRILHLCPMTQLLMLTSETEYALTPSNGGDVVTPTSIDPKPQSYIGSAEVQPTIINTSMVYAAARGGHVRELGYAWTVNGFQTGDLSLRAAHLFDNLTIIDQAYSKSPKPIIWFVSSGGKLLGLTYIPEEQLGAWHQHDTQGSFESICCVAEGDEDFLYAVINRTINGVTVRYVERMASRVIDKDDPSTWFFVDAGISQTFAVPAKVISGLDWLEGAVVKVLADGFLQEDKTVVAGTITLDRAASQVAIGLEYVSDLFTLPPVMQIPGFGQGTNKNISRAWVKVYQSSQLLVGPDEDHLMPVKQRTDEPWGTPQSLKSEDLELLTDPLWQQQGQILIRQVDPLPLEVVALTLEVTTGG